MLVLRQEGLLRVVWRLEHRVGTRLAESVGDNNGGKGPGAGWLCYRWVDVDPEPKTLNQIPIEWVFSPWLGRARKAIKVPLRTFSTGLVRTRSKRPKQLFSRNGTGTSPHQWIRLLERSTSPYSSLTQARLARMAAVSF